MADTLQLTLAYVESQPQAAARTMSLLDPAEAAELVDSFPTRIASQLMLHMGAWPASVMLQHAKPVVAAAVLAELDYQSAASIFRLISPEERPAIYEVMPHRLRADLERALAYPADTVGALMTSRIVTMSPSETIANARETLTQRRQSELDVVFVVDAKKKLQGIVSALTILRQPATRVLSDVMDTDIVKISARARLSNIRDLPAWHQNSCLPVLSRSEELIGALSRRQALREVSTPTGREGDGTSILSSVVAAYVHCMFGLAWIVADATDVNDSPKTEVL